MGKFTEYLVDEKILILTEKEYNPNFKDNIYYCYDSFNYKSAFNWKVIFNKKVDAFSYFEYQVGFNNKPKNYFLLEANDKYEEITGYRKKDIIGKKITDILFDDKDTSTELIKKFYKTAINGYEQKFNITSKLNGKNYCVFTYSPLKNFFALVFREEPVSAEMQKIYQNYYIRVADILNKVCTSQAVIVELENPLKLKNTKKLGVISLDFAKYLGILDKNVKLKKPAVVNGLHKSIMPIDKKNLIEKLEHKKINTLSNYKDYDTKIKKNNLYFMIR